ncbi:unnamed protein product [Absidia cylindrospora]
MRLFKKNPPERRASDSSNGKAKKEKSTSDHHAKGPTPKSSESFWQHRRTRTFAIISLTVVAIILIAIVPIIIVQQLQQQHVGQSNHHAPASPTTPSPNNSTNSTNNANPTSSTSSTTSPKPHHPNPYNDSAQANPHVPPLNQDFHYIKTPVRGINLGGWLVLEPFITPSLFEQAPDTTKPPNERYDTSDRVAVDEWTLCQRLGPTKAKSVLEHHYDTFIKEADFKKIREMGFNHVRIPIGHWSIRPMAHEPFVPRVSWTYLIRGIQWARKYGLRVMVELHTAPGSQNGWNHSGRSGEIRWLNGEDDAQDDDEEDNEDVVSMNSTQSNRNNTASATSGNKWSHVVPIIGVLNEPAMMEIKD